MAGWHHQLNGHEFEEGSRDAEAEAPILWPSDSFEKTLMLGKTEGRRRRG